MAENEGHIVTLTCDCGHQFKEALAGKDLDTYEFNCPACGVSERLKPADIDALVGADAEARDKLRKKMLGLDLGPGWVKNSGD